MKKTCRRFTKRENSAILLIKIEVENLSPTRHLWWVEKCRSPDSPAYLCTKQSFSAFFMLRKEILMNKYKKMIELIEDNGLEIQSKECYDSQSAWTGKNLWIVDKKERNKIFDLSGNGYCFNDQSVDKAIEEVEKYLSLKNMNTFDDFKEWVEKNAKPRK